MNGDDPTHRVEFLLGLSPNGMLSRAHSLPWPCTHTAKVPPRIMDTLSGQTDHCGQARR